MQLVLWLNCFTDYPKHAGCVQRFTSRVFAGCPAVVMWSSQKASACLSSGRYTLCYAHNQCCIDLQLCLTVVKHSITCSHCVQWLCGWVLQDASCSDLEQPDSIRLPLIGALHAVLEGNKASQLAFQAAGGVEVIMHLLAQASPRPQVCPCPQGLAPAPAHPNDSLLVVLKHQLHHLCVYEHVTHAVAKGFWLCCDKVRYVLSAADHVQFTLSVHTQMEDQIV